MGLLEFIILLLLVLLLVGTTKFPQIAKEFGSAIRNFKDGIQGQNPNNRPSNFNKSKIENS